MEVITKNFKGKTALWKVFWIQNILAGTLLQITVEKIGPHLSTIPLFILGSFCVLFTIWVVIGMWQCAFNVKWKGWGYIVRVFYSLLLAIVLMSLIQSM